MPAVRLANPQSITISDWGECYCSDNPKLQAAGLPGMPQYTSIAHCVRVTVAGEGVRGLYRGLLPNFMKTLPAISISYAVFEKVKSAMMQSRQ